MKIKNTIFLWLITISGSSYGQIDFKRQVPVAPEVAALSEYVLTPVSEYTGVPNINIPLLSVTEDNVAVALSLSYHAGGIRVNEEASNIGLGWVLNAGGMITRSVEGKDDLVAWGYAKSNPIFPDPPLDGNGYFNPDYLSVLPSDGNCNFLYNGEFTYFNKPSPGIQNNQEDLIPDIFHYNFNGYSGSFVFNGTGEVHFLEKTSLKITLLEDDIFQAITPDGTTYTFARKITDEIDPSDPSYTIIPHYISSWFLTRIVTPKKGAIDFVYEFREDIRPLASYRQVYLQNEHVEAYSYEIETGLLISFQPYPNFFRRRSLGGTLMITKGNYLTEISFSSGKVKFNYSDQGSRMDIKTGYYLRSIALYDSQDEASGPVREFDLYHSYFGTSSTLLKNVDQNGDCALEVHADQSDSDLGLRLKLDSIVENKKRIYSFEYHEPVYTIRKTSLSQDHWGLFNNQINKHSFIPNLPETNIPGNTVVRPEYDAKRYADENSAKAFTLNKITYPTRGYTIFEHELHTYENNVYAIPSCPQKIDVISSSDNGGGLISDTFTIDSQYSYNKVSIDYKVSIYVGGGGGDPGTYRDLSNIYFQIEDAIGELVPDSRLQINSETAIIDDLGQAVSAGYKKDLYLPNGTYTVKVNLEPLNNIQSIAKAEIHWISEDVSPTQQYGIGGGLRIKTITDYDHNGIIQLKRNFDYHYTENDADGTTITKSYGSIRNKPDYSGKHNEHPLDSRYSGIPLHGISQDGQVTIDASPLGLSSQVRNSPDFITKQSNTTLYRDLGSYVGYDQVSITFESDSKPNGKEVFYFLNRNNRFRTIFLGEYDFFTYRFPHIKDIGNGLLIKKETYKNDGIDDFKMISSIEHTYKFNGIDHENFLFEDTYKNTDYVLGGYKLSLNRMTDISTNNPALVIVGCEEADLYKFQLHPYYSHLIQKSSTIEITYDTNGENPIVTESNYQYNDLHPTLIAATETTNSTGEVIESKTWYPDDITEGNSLGAALTPQEMEAVKRLQKDGEECRIGQPIQIETVTNGRNVIQRTNFRTWDNITLPEFVQIAQGDDIPEDRLIYYDYDDQGNPLEISKANGTHIIYVWGYNKQYPIAKIENASYTEISPAAQTTINEAISASDMDSNTASENILRDRLQDIREHPYFQDARVTTYTYDPLIGVTSMTDPKGYTVYYEYDELNRPEFVKDHEKKFISQNKYKYKN